MVFNSYFEDFFFLSILSKQNVCFSHQNTLKLLGIEILDRKIAAQKWIAHNNQK